ncbi:keratin, type I cytoskeletal 18-like [Aplochiton taeniatus]
MGQPFSLPGSLRGSNYAHSVVGGAGGHGTRFSNSYYLQPMRSETSGEMLHQAGALKIGNEKLTMQNLNDRLASYLETVRNLEQANSKLEIKIREAMETKGPEAKSYDKYNVTIMDLRNKVFEMTKDNAKLAIACDNASLAMDDFRAKLEYEIMMRQSVDADLVKLRKLLDETNVSRLHLESDIESLKEELVLLRKNHKTEMAELRVLVTAGSVQVDVDAPKGQDLALIMEEMRSNYERIALKNQQELKTWHESKITEVQVQVTENTTALKSANSKVSEMRRKWQSLEIEMQSQMSLKASLEGTLRDVDMRYNMQLEKYNETIMRLQAELTQIRSSVTLQKEQYQALFNIKVRLEAEIAEYRRLLEGDLIIDEEEERRRSKIVQTKVVTVTQTLVDGKVVSEHTDVDASQKEVEEAQRLNHSDKAHYTENPSSPPTTTTYGSGSQMGPLLLCASCCGLFLANQAWRSALETTGCPHQVAEVRGPPKKNK